MKKRITADLFCGAGGASTGIHQACEELGYVAKNYCINHWKTAIETHSKNHAHDIHVCAPIETVIPDELVREGYLDLLWASPSCTHHSRAKGGKPRSNQLRAQPNVILDWLDMLYVRRLIVENVWEFTQWGALDFDGQPIPSRKGESFRMWVASIETRGYTVEYRKLNCANYGDATTRERFFLQAVKRGKIVWPNARYAETPKAEGQQKKWCGIGECLDLSNLGTPISHRKKPLSQNTMKRIAEGIRRFHGEKFLMDFLGSDKPLNGRRVSKIDKPMRTQHCSNRFGIAMPFVVDFLRNGKEIGMGEPIKTQHCKDRFAVATPFIVKLEKGSKPSGINEPISTQTTSGKFTVCTPIIIPQHAPARPRSADEPVSTITTTGAIGLVTPVMVDFANGGRCRPIDKPMTTLTTKNSMCIATPVTDGDHCLIDVYFRMLTPEELKRASGFPEDYVLAGNKSDQVKQIGNAVPVGTARALAKASLSGIA